MNCDVVYADRSKRAEVCLELNRMESAIPEPAVKAAETGTESARGAEMSYWSND